MLVLYLIIGLMIIFSSLQEEDTFLNNPIANNMWLMLLFILLSIGIYSLSIHEYNDLPNYSYTFYRLGKASFLDITYYYEPLFTFFQWMIAHLFDSFSVFILIIWAIIFFNYIRSIYNGFGSFKIVFVMFSYLSFFIFFSYIFNTMRQGVAISFILLGVSTLLSTSKDGKYTFYICIIIAPLVHSTSLVASLVLLVLKYFQPTLKQVLIAWSACVLLFLSGLNSLLSFLPIEDIEVYTSNTVIREYGATNRLDFLVFGIVFGGIGLFIYYYFNQTTDFELLIKAYFMFNCLFLLFGYIGYSDRLAAYSWLLAPYLIWKGVDQVFEDNLVQFLVLCAFCITGYLMGGFEDLLVLF